MGTRRKPTASDTGGVLPPNDPRRPLKIKRLTEARARIQQLLQRDPAMDDPDYDEWDLAVQTLLTELFDPSTYLLRFRNLTLRPISYNIYGNEWYGEPRETWQNGLKQADRILGEALEEAAIEIPSAALAVPVHRTAQAPPVVVNIHNENMFSPTIHVTFAQQLYILEAMDLTAAEKTIAKDHLAVLETETSGAKRWPIIANALEGLKSLGKNIYKDIAVPLIVEFMKHEAGLTHR